MKKLLLDAAQLEANMNAIVEAMHGMMVRPENTAILGIRTRGAVMAERLQRMFSARYDITLPVGLLDISLYRDDLSQLAVQPVVRRTQLDFDVQDKLILLIDDVLYTGRTIRSAIDEIIDFGRPKSIKLLVLVDRGGREIPIQADFAAQVLDVAEDEVVKVCLSECDETDQVIINDRKAVKAE
jgi:pyrimidine operon attenuation protein/uracil phosphoribosyltransferase